MCMACKNFESIHICSLDLKILEQKLKMFGSTAYRQA